MDEKIASATSCWVLAFEKFSPRQGIKILTYFSASSLFLQASIAKLQYNARLAYTKCKKLLIVAFSLSPMQRLEDKEVVRIANGGKS
jgi:hypothetical protein